MSQADTIIRDTWIRATTMKHSAFIAAAAAMTLPATGHADALIEALQASKLHADFRLRYETVDDAVNRDADALTLRSRIGFTSGQFSRFSILAEFVDVRVVAGVDDYAPERAGYAVVADPETTEVNRAVLRYQGIEGLDLAAGRQRIIYDNARFVGNVGWRQNEQTFDSFSAIYEPAAGWVISYAWIDRVRGVTSAPNLTYDANSHLLNVRYGTLPIGTLSGYGYLLENKDSGAEVDIWGLRLNGDHATDTLTWLYSLEYAWQDATTAAGADFDAHYWAAELGLRSRGVTARLGWEVLGSDGGDYGFDTPLATKHAFNGWADQFLATPAAGLRDRYISISGDVAGINLLAVYHWYDADKGSADYGTELNLQAVRHFGKHYSLGAKFARYRADDLGNDTNKFWLWGELRF